MKPLHYLLVVVPLSVPTEMVSGQEPAELPPSVRRLLAAKPQYVTVSDLIPQPPLAAPAAAVQETIVAPAPLAVEADLPAEPEYFASAECCTGGPVHKFWHHRFKPHMQWSHWGYPENFCERPFGAFNHAAMAAQIGSGYAAQMTLYRFDFITLDGQPGVALSAKGNSRLARLAELLAVTPYPLVIELDEYHPEANAARRRHVLSQLKRLTGEDIPDQRVVVSAPATRGRLADEAILLQDNVLRQVQSGVSQVGPGQAGGMTGGSTGELTTGTGSAGGNY